MRVGVPIARQRPASDPIHRAACDVHDALAYFASVYQRAGYHGRVRAVFRLDNAEASVLLVRSPDGPLGEHRVRGDVGWTMSAHDTNVDTLAHDPLPITHLMMDDLWQAYGFERCLLFTPGGDWRPRG
jgi:hypothetical protein